MNLQEFSINDTRVRHISEQDEQMKKLIAWIGPVQVKFRDDYFASMVQSIIAQLISREAADAVNARVIKVTGGVTPENVLACPFDTLKSAGLTARKTEYIRNLAEKIVEGEFNFDALNNLSNDAVIKKLTTLKGIGQWTAHVFLILSLKRENVLAEGDIALQRAASWLYKTDKKYRKETLIEQAQKWVPYRSIGCLYLWEIIHLKLIEQYETLDDAMLDSK